MAEFNAIFQKLDSTDPVDIYLVFMSYLTKAGFKERLEYSFVNLKSTLIIGMVSLVR